MGVPTLDSDHLLAWLRLRLRRPDVQFAVPPTLLGMGGEAVVDAFTLQGAPPELRGPLVVRRLTLRNDRFQASWESSIHTLLRSCGYPAPRVHLVEPDAQPLGAPFLIMDRLAGSILLAAGARSFPRDDAADAHVSDANRYHTPSAYDPELRYWVLDRYTAIRSVLLDSRFGVSDGEARCDASEAVPTLRSGMLLFLDSPRHERLRSLCATPFHPRRVAALRPLVTRVARECIARIEHGATDDLIGDLAAVVPVRIIAEILGLPRAEIASLRRWSTSLAVDLVELVKPAGARPEAAEAQPGPDRLRGRGDAEIRQPDPGDPPLRAKRRDCRRPAPRAR